MIQERVKAGIKRVRTTGQRWGRRAIEETDPVLCARILELRQQDLGMAAITKRGVFSHVLKKILNRFDDPAAAFVPWYIELRIREATALNTFGESLLDLAQRHLSDRAVISAEVRARAGEFRFAAQLIAGIPQGSMPLFTEGFSLLTHRIRELLDLDFRIRCRGATSFYRGYREAEDVEAESRQVGTIYRPQLPDRHVLR